MYEEGRLETCTYSWCTLVSHLPSTILSHEAEAHSPISSLSSSISLIDRTNISLANAAGMSTELQLRVGDRYSIALLMFFPTYSE